MHLILSTRSVQSVSLRGKGKFYCHEITLVFEAEEIIEFVIEPRKFRYYFISLHLNTMGLT
jgi:hypothetical protein